MGKEEKWCRRLSFLLAILWVALNLLERRDFSPFSSFPDCSVRKGGSGAGKNVPPFPEGADFSRPDGARVLVIQSEFPMVKMEYTQIHEMKGTLYT
ncbi:MAG: hypothetical protein J6331_00640, partial [Lentisphaeria bacterium]|nr:hypothetical protein [Lentisphaeria bacterium]